MSRVLHYVTGVGFWVVVILIAGLVAPLFLIIAAVNACIPPVDVDRRIREGEDEILGARARHLDVRLIVKTIPVKVHAIVFDCPDAPNILMIHGIAGSGLSFLNVAEHLADFNVYLVDLPGFGRSSGGNFQEIQALYENPADFLLDVLEAFIHRIGEVYLIGHSFGGYLCVRLARKVRVQGIVLIDSAGLLPTLGRTGAYWAFVFKFSLPNIGRYLGTLGYHLAPGYWYALVAHPGGFGDRFVSHLITLNVFSAYWNHPVIDHFPVDCPVRLVYGEADEIMPPHQGKFIQKMFPGYGLMIVPGAGHNPMTGSGEAIAKFIRELPGDKGGRGVAVGRVGRVESSFYPPVTEEVIEKLYIQSCGV